jgi:hypothetical protein
MKSTELKELKELRDITAFYAQLYASLVAAQSSVIQGYADNARFHKVDEIINLGRIHDEVSERLTQIDPDGGAIHAEPKTPKSLASVEMTIEDDIECGLLVVADDDNESFLAAWCPTPIRALIERLGVGAMIRLTLEEL